jgi:homoserine kinase type II
MAVYTELSLATAAPLFERLGLGPLVALEGVASGIENTNYFATTAQAGSRQRWVLTLFERLPAAELPYYLRLMQHLAKHGMPVPAPQATPDGLLTHELAGKPAAVVTRLAGSERSAPSAAHCALLGHWLAKMHVAGRDFVLQQPHPRGQAWCEQTAQALAPLLLAPLTAQLQAELAYQRTVMTSAAGAALPHGAIHADLFRDNALFESHIEADQTTDALSGIFDFYFAGHGPLLFDVAVCLNDWCTDPHTGALEENRAQALVAAYDAVRALEPTERRLLPALLRAAALRFWLSRLADWHQPRAAHLLQAKDPAHFERVLAQRIAVPWHPGLAS